MRRSGKQYPAGASSSIYATIKDVEEILLIIVPRGSSPDESRRNMINILEEFFDWNRYYDSLDEGEDKDKIAQMYHDAYCR